MDAEIDKILAGGESRFPDFTAFVPADLATAERIAEHHADGKAVVIVAADGSETFLPVP